MQRRCLLHEGIMRNQLHIPHGDASLCTHQFLNDIFESKVFVWSMEDLRTRNCVSSPGLGELQAMTIEAI